ncbi:probable transporter (major facilitator superfamily) [Cephalotrichum gorgonifer]|uniref:Probable transporter (Major facilitator superfamily) n=1 Tax=Cephalotrichum gorgonifer TaxID=2041049 RepID=A0AAE8MZI3_9PEZI|nr:probable transporter (major facilitator superfamily) [Cephalotrichum gorgonifer]
MSTSNGLKPGAGPQIPDITQAVATLHDQGKQGYPVEKIVRPTQEITSNLEEAPADDDPEKIAPAEDAQRGVQQIEAVTIVWSKKWLIGLLVNIWFIYLVNGLRLSILSGLTPYVTSDFESHSLLTVIGIVTEAMTSAVYIPMAKLLDLWGRAEGFLLMVVFSTLGVILMATSHNLAMFCASQVFYSIGFAGIIYTIDIFSADVTTLKNRGLAYAFTSSPYMITAFAGSKAAEGFLEHVTWRWGFGCFAVIIPAVSLPLFGIIKFNLHKAEKRGIILYESSGRTFWQNLWYYGIEQCDAPGVVLFAGGLTVFLLPFNLASSAPDGWATDYIIAMIVVGFVILALFAAYEIYLAPVPFMKAEFLADRTIIGVCVFDAVYMISYYCWASYFTSFLQVVCNLGVAEAGYVNSTFEVVSGVLLFIVGYLIRRTGRFKWLFYICVPVYILGLGLMIYFRKPNQQIGYIIMCEIFISIGGSVFILLLQVAVLAAVDHQHIAAAMAFLSVSGTVGAAMGNTISGTIWTNTFYSALLRYLPESAMENIDMIYEDLETQLLYEVGSPTRIGIQKAYGYAQTRMLAAGIGIFGLGFLSMMMIRNYDVSKKTRQTKGIVF